MIEGSVDAGLIKKGREGCKCGWLENRWLGWMYGWMIDL